MEFIGELSTTSSADIIAFIKEIVERFPNLRSEIIENLFSTLRDVRTKNVIRGALWILGEYCTGESHIKAALHAIRLSLGELPILDTEQKLLQKENEENGDNERETHNVNSTRRILADGTYATESVLTESKVSSKVARGPSRPPLRALILDGDYYLATILAASLTKLVMRFSELSGNSDVSNSFRAEAMLAMSSIIRVGQSPLTKTRIDEDSVDRITICFRSLAEYKTIKDIEDVFLADTRSAYSTLLKADDKVKRDQAQAEKNKSAVQVDDGLSIRQLARKTPDKTIDMVQCFYTLANSIPE